jgi:hypothetical protein
LRHIVWAPDYEHVRWRALKVAAGEMLERSTSPTVVVAFRK